MLTRTITFALLLLQSGYTSASYLNISSLNQLQPTLETGANNEANIFQNAKTPRIRAIENQEGTQRAAINEQPKLQRVIALTQRPGNVTVSKSGRIFVTMHPLGSDKYQLMEIKNGKAIPFPELKYQKNGKKADDSHFDTMLGLTIDQNDQLWVIDMGLNLGKTRLFAFDLKKNKLLRKIELSKAIAPPGSFVQDVVIDEKHERAYLADITDPGIISLNLRNAHAQRFGGHASLQAEDKDIVIDGKTVFFNGKPARVAVNPITLSNNRDTLFFGAMNGTTWYKVPTDALEEHDGINTFNASISIAGEKPMSDGALTDKQGRHYFTDLQRHAITRLDNDGKLKMLIQDSATLLWPDNISLMHDGWMYISVNQLNKTPAFTGSKDMGQSPYAIYRFKLQD